MKGGFLTTSGLWSILLFNEMKGLFAWFAEIKLFVWKYLIWSGTTTPGIQYNTTRGNFRSVAGGLSPSVEEVIARGNENDIPLQKRYSAWTKLSFNFSEAIAQRKSLQWRWNNIKNALMSGSFPVSKLRFNLKQCACAVKMRVSTFASLAVSNVHNSFVWIVMLFYGEYKVVRTYWKMLYSACLLSRKVTIKTVRNFAFTDTVTLSHVLSNSQFFNKPVASMWLEAWNRENYTIYSTPVE